MELDKAELLTGLEHDVMIFTLPVFENSSLWPIVLLDVHVIICSDSLWAGRLFHIHLYQYYIYYRIQYH